MNRKWWNSFNEPITSWEVLSWPELYFMHLQVYKIALQRGFFHDPYFYFHEVLFKVLNSCTWMWKEQGETICIYFSENAFTSWCHCNVGHSRLTQPAQKNNEEGLHISSVFWKHLWAAIIDAGSILCLLEYDLSLFLSRYWLLTASSFASMVSLCGLLIISFFQL